MPAHPELPFVVVRFLVLVLLDRYRAVRRLLGEFRIDVVTGGSRPIKDVLTFIFWLL
jgi:hypothetical protein